MGLRKILTDSEPALHKVCKPVENFDWRLHKLLKDMTDTLIDSGGVLAGILFCLLVCRLLHRKTGSPGG